MTAIGIPGAVHIGAAQLPFVDIGDGSKLKVIMVDPAQELWIIENVFMAGYEVQRHKHTGPVYAYTTSGAWQYKEYPDDINRAGSFLFEPANSVHTLQILEDETHVWFQIYGANLNLDAQGEVESVSDGPHTLEVYLSLCEQSGLPRPNVFVPGIHPPVATLLPAGIHPPVATLLPAGIHPPVATLLPAET